MGIEEQQEEREILSSIYPDEITDVSETEFRIAIVLDVNVLEDGASQETDQPTIILNVQYPPTYPDAPPTLTLSQPPNNPKHPFLSLHSDKPHLVSLLSTTAEENLGMPMIFTLVQTLKDGAELLITERMNAQQALKEIEAQREEEEENRKFQGQAVTRESFLEWRERFRAEVEEEKRVVEEREGEEARRRKGREETKLTGKELWVQGLVGKGEWEGEGEGEGERDALEGMERLGLGGKEEGVGVK